MFSIFNIELYGGNLKFFVLAFIVWALYFAIREKNFRGGFLRKMDLFANKFVSYNKDSGFDASSEAALRFRAVVFLTFEAVLYFLTVSVTTPYLVDRYITPMYPLAVILTVLLFFPIIDDLFKSRRVGAVIFALIMSIPLLLRLSGGIYDSSKAEMSRLALEHSQDYCILFGGISKEENYFELEKYKGIYKMKLNRDYPVDERIAASKELVVYIPEGRDVQEYFDYVKKYVPYLKEFSRLYKAYYSSAYLFR